MKSNIRMKRLIFVCLACVWGIQLAAQPARTRVNNRTTTAAANKEKKVDRASLQFPAAVEMPEDVVWRRDVYRQLNLLDDKNAPLYYPVEPTAGHLNLFTYLFNLLITDKVKAYEYKLDGNESFTAKDVVDMKQLMERHYIYYEEKNGKIQVSASDIPSAEVSRYYIKESVYFDQRTSTFRTKVTALCPVLMRGDVEFGGEATPYPLFWLKYDDISTYLAKHMMMPSNYNNVTNLSASDYFSMNSYEGTIYKTNNMQGRVLANYCKTDSAMKKEQTRIEKEIETFENHVWGHADSVAVAADSTVVEEAEKKTARRTVRTTSSRRTATAEKQETVKPERTKASAPKSAATPTVSVRRQRR